MKASLTHKENTDRGDEEEGEKVARHGAGREIDNPRLHSIRDSESKQAGARFEDVGC
jgi:hypothetical protein